MDTVVIGLLGPVLDKGKNPDRWNRWRPSVSLARQDDLKVDRIELLVQSKFQGLGDIVAEDIRSVSPDTVVNLHRVTLPDPWDFASVYGSLADFAEGYSFDEENEEYLVHISTGTHVSQICMFLLTETRRIPARLIQTSPHPKDRSDPGEYRVIDLDLSRYDRLASRFEGERREGVSFLKAGIETRDERFNALMDRIEEVALASDAPMLLTGPTGVGKTALARRVYELKNRSRKVSGRFVELNCATLRGDAAMSMLFGHKAGAFTGAVNARDGLLLHADGGLLFLDEVGELGLDEQTMLLRAIEEGTFLPLGADDPVSSRFQLLAGTNRDLGAAVREGTFREDLLARLCLWTFELPALRDRLADIEPNLEYELRRQTEVLDRKVTFNKEARERFLSFATSKSAAWRGNFRDFSAAIERMATLAPGGRIAIEAVREEIERLERSWNAIEPSRSQGYEDLLGDCLGDQATELDLFDQVQLAEVIRVCRESPTQSAAGRTLFAVSRAKRTSTNDADRLAKYLARFDLSWKKIQG